MGQVDVPVLHRVSLDIARGELLVIAGPSGSGKTTLLNLVGGMDRPTAGTILYGDQPLTSASDRQLTQYRRNVVGFVFQFYNLVPALTARENVQVATEIAQRPLGADEVLQRVELAQRADHFPSQLSGGEQQRVAIARALAKNPQLILCDEPTGALDYGTGKKVLRLLVDVHRDLGKTVLIITHNTAIAEVADRVVHLRSGEIVDIRANQHPARPEDISW